MNFAPPTTGLYPGQETKPAAEEPPPVDDGKPQTAAQRLAALKAKLSDARKTNRSQGTIVLPPPKSPSSPGSPSGRSSPSSRPGSPGFEAKLVDALGYVG